MWPFHKHEWKEINRETVQAINSFVFSRYQSYTGVITRITFKCGCGKYRQERLRGTVWEKESLQCKLGN